LKPNGTISLPFEGVLNGCLTSVQLHWYNPAISQACILHQLFLAPAYPSK
jgi:hypothetical protein